MVALKLFKLLKTPGPDGLHLLFCKKLWNLVGTKTMDFCIEVFSNFSMPSNSNANLIYLILKCKNIVTLNNLRPIGLCNTTYKFVAKIIVNRINPYLSSIIRSSQDSFLANRRSLDHAILIQEYITYFSKIRVKNCNMILKINLEKSFDKIEWSFIKDTLLFFGFPDNLTKLIMSCISTSSIVVLLKMRKTRYFNPRGIR